MCESGQRQVAKQPPTKIITKGERPGDSDPEDGDNCHRGEAVHHDCEDVFAADHSSVKQGEPGSHKEDECRTENDPESVS